MGMNFVSIAALTSILIHLYRTSDAVEELIRNDKTLAAQAEDIEGIRSGLTNAKGLHIAQIGFALLLIPFFFYNRYVVFKDPAPVDTQDSLSNEEFQKRTERASRVQRTC